MRSGSFWAKGRKLVPMMAQSSMVDRSIDVNAARGSSSCMTVNPAAQSRRNQAVGGLTRPCHESPDGRRAHRHLRVAIRGMARRLLSERARPAPRAGIRQPSVSLGGDQRLVLLAATARVLPAVVSRYPGRLRV